MKELTFDKNQIVFKQGSFDTSMYCVNRGLVGVFVNYETENQKKIAEFEKDQLFGEIGLIGCLPRTATAVALEDGTELTEIRETDLNHYFKDKPEQLLLLMKQLSHRLRVTTQKYMDVCKTIYENDQEQRRGDPRSAWIAEHMDLYCEEYTNSGLR